MLFWIQNAPSVSKRLSFQWKTLVMLLGKLEFATEAYNYNTMDDADPRNLVLLCTSQGMAVQQDGCGAKKLFHHAVDDMGEIHRYWLEAEESKHKVGGEQRETDAERAEAQARGKATSSVIGIRAMGQRFNVLMTIQVPLKQKTPMDDGWCAFGEMEEACAKGVVLGLWWEWRFGKLCDASDDASIDASIAWAQQCWHLHSCSSFSWIWVWHLARFVYSVAWAAPIWTCHHHGCHVQHSERWHSKCRWCCGSHRWLGRCLPGLFWEWLAGRWHDELHEGGIDCCRHGFYHIKAHVSASQSRPSEPRQVSIMGGTAFSPFQQTRLTIFVQPVMCVSQASHVQMASWSGNGENKWLTRGGFSGKQWKSPQESPGWSFWDSVRRWDFNGWLQERLSQPASQKHRFLYDQRDCSMLSSAHYNPEEYRLEPADWKETNATSCMFCI